jgi:nondiscriminating aspartyl-tRNA synthetase
MIERVLARDIRDNEGAEVSVSGWVHRTRELGAISFVLLRDRSGLTQLVFDGKVDFTLESVIEARGMVKANEKAPGGFELQVSHAAILAPARPELSFPVNQDPDNIGIEAVLDNRIMSLRNPKILDIFRLQSGIIQIFPGISQVRGFHGNQNFQAYRFGHGRGYRPVRSKLFRH